MKFIIIPISEIFNDVAETIRYGLDELNYETIILNKIVEGYVHILLGSHLIEDWSNVPRNSIIYNLEQLNSDSVYLSELYVQKLNEFQVWDYSKKNIEWLHRSQSNLNPVYMPVGYVPTLSKVHKSELQDIDVLFYGWLNDRRKKIIDELINFGLRVEVLNKTFGSELDWYISRSKVVVNIHFYESKIFEIIRVSYLLSNCKAVVSEIDDETEIDPMIKNAIVGVSYENLSSTCLELVRDDSKRKEIERLGFELFSTLPEHEYLKNGLRLMQVNREILENQQDLVSVVIPCFNQAPFLEECLRSVSNQNYKNIEIIIINDGSTDDSKQIIDKLINENKNLNIISLEQENSGVSVARNRGIEISKGNYILPLDGDDKIHPDMILKCMQLLNIHSEISIAYTDYQHFGDVDLIVETPEYDFNILAYHKCLHTVTALYRKNCWTDTGGYNPNMIWGTEDWEFWINCGRHNHFGKRIAEPLFFYRTRLEYQSRIKQANAHSEALFARIVLNNSAIYDADRNNWAKLVWSSTLVELQKNDSDKVLLKYVRQLSPTSLISECELLIDRNNLEYAINLYSLWLDNADSNLKYAIYFNLAVCHENNKSIEKAKGAYRKSLSENPRFNPSIVNLNRINKCNNFGESWIDLEMDFECEIHHCFPRQGGNPNSFKVLNIATEPSVWCISSKDLRNIYSQFDLILTYRNDLLDLPNTKFMLYGGCFVTEKPRVKRFEVSFLYSVGLGSDMPGYQLRKEIWDSRRELPSILNYFSSTLRPPKESDKTWPYKTKDKLFESMFSLIIENTSEENYFTEKIIDAFQTYTIPIYWGCPNIDQYFDMDGILYMNNFKDLEKILSTLTSEFYYDKLQSVINNYRKSLEYKDILKNIKKNIDFAFDSKVEST